MKELRSLPHRVSLGLSGGVRGGGGGGWAKIRGFFRLSPIWSCAKPRGQISVLWGKWLFRRPREKQASSDAADAVLGVWLMLLMLVVSWPRCLGVSADAADAGRIVATLCVLLQRSCSRRAATCLSVYVWRKVGLLGQNLLTCRSLCVAMCSYVGTKLLVLTCYVGSKLLPPVLFSATFCLLQCGLAPAASLSWQLQ